MKQQIFLSIVLGVSGVWQSLAWAHGDVFERIQQVEANIALQPDEAEHYIERSRLYTEHGQYSDALADLSYATKLAPNHPRLDYERARVQWQNAIDPETAQQPALKQAHRVLSPYLQRQPDDYQAHHLMGRVLDKQQEQAQALAHYNQAIKLHPEPGVELFIERAQLLRAMERTDASLDSLDEAVQRIGPVKILIDLALEQELARGNAEGGLYWLEQLPEESAGLPSTLITKGDLLLQLNHPEEALLAYCQAKMQLDQLPAKVREAPRISQLLEQIVVSDSDCRS